MAGYTRQSIADIVNGLDITAPPLTAEFNQIDAAFHGTTGHAHDGSTGNGPKISLTSGVQGYLPAANGGLGGINKIDATVAPVATNDNLQGYVPGSVWINMTNGRCYRCVGNATNAAVWREEILVISGNQITPIATGTVDLGTSAIRFKDAYIGSLNTTGAATVGGNLAVTGTSTFTGSTSHSAITVSGTSTLGTTTISGGTINNATVGATTASTVRGTNITATTGFSGPLTGAVTGNVTGNLTGNVTGDVTGNLSGNVTAATGTSTFQELTVNGSLNMNAGTTATVTGLSAPVNATDAATKSYVDTSISNLVATAPATLDTLNELAVALGNDASFATNVTTSIGTKLTKAGDTMTGALAMGTNKITGLGTPTAAADAATKAYVDTADGLQLNLTGGTMTGAIAMGTNKITGLGTPTLATDAVNKSYSDTLFGSTSAAATSAAAAATSATNAATSATAAGTSATNASSSATAAAASATSASTSATAASTSATNASASATAAAASAASNNPATLVNRTSGTGSAIVPTGTAAQRDVSPAAGYFRFNADIGKFEGYNGTAWGSVGGGATGGGADEVFIQNGKTVTTNYTIPSTRNAMSVGPVTVSAGITVTVSSDARYVVI